MIYYNHVTTFGVKEGIFKNFEVLELATFIKNNNY